jgi:iron complex transport system substrate-binding protein
MNTAMLPTFEEANRPRAGTLRIVSLAASSTEMVFALGAGERLIGVSKYCDYPAAALERPMVGSFLDADYEAIRRAAPDLVLTQSHLQREIVARLIDLNLNVVSFHPVSLAGVVEMVLLIGKLVGREIEAESLAEQMRARMEAVRADSASLPSKPRVSFEGWGSPLIPAGGWEAECVEVAGGTSIFPFPAHVHSRNREIHSGDVIRANPELIVVSWPGSFGRIRPQKIEPRAGWERIEAVQAPGLCHGSSRKREPES